jgi:hypothetical protein
MKEKKAKLKLEDIKVESFITALDENTANRLIGATDDGDACATPPSPTCVSCLNTCATCNQTCGVTCPTCFTSPYMSCCVD